jgi:hypothetical protein
LKALLAVFALHLPHLPVSMTYDLPLQFAHRAAFAADEINTVARANIATVAQ